MLQTCSPATLRFDIDVAGVRRDVLKGHSNINCTACRYMQIGANFPLLAIVGKQGRRFQVALD
ncbi:hypothetical protein [Arenicella xantha]|nr:hypothetical protein [Arenicella xantha]